MICEKWRPIEGYEGLYEISNFGNVKSLYKNTRIRNRNTQILTPKIDNHGYFRVNLYKQGKCKSELVSRLVATAFLENTNNMPMVGHNDDNKQNNRVDNLYWTDAYENNRHNGKLERFHISHRQQITKIAEKLSIKIKGTSLDGSHSLFFNSTQEAKRNGFDSGKISMCINGKRNSHKGYIWERI